MNQAAVDESLSSEKKFIVEIERTGNYEGIDDFFETEEKLLYHLYKLDKKEAQRLARVMVDYVLSSSDNDELKMIKYYFITLSGIVARYLKKQQLDSSKSFTFNAACISLIEQKLTKDNASDLAVELIEFYTYVIADRNPPSLMHHTVNKVINYINSDVESTLTVEEISTKFDVSTSHLSRVFREHAGITLVEYINIRKVEESQYYLRFSDKKISEISDQFDFCNQSYFTRIFKKYTGETPRRFRTNLTSDYYRFTLPGEEDQQMDDE